MESKDNIINLLALSMGMDGLKESKNSDSFYDAKTGTLYYDGMAISKITADKAVKYFEMMESRCNKEDHADREMKMIYRCAIEAIKMMQAEKVKILLQEELKECENL